MSKLSSVAPAVATGPTLRPAAPATAMAGSILTRMSLDLLTAIVAEHLSSLSSLAALSASSKSLRRLLRECDVTVDSTRHWQTADSERAGADMDEAVADEDDDGGAGEDASTPHVPASNGSGLIDAETFLRFIAQFPNAKTLKLSGSLTERSNLIRIGSICRSVSRLVLLVDTDRPSDTTAAAGATAFAPVKSVVDTKTRDDSWLHRSFPHLQTLIWIDDCDDTRAAARNVEECFRVVSHCGVSLTELDILPASSFSSLATPSASMEAAFQQLSKLTALRRIALNGVILLNDSSFLSTVQHWTELRTLFIDDLNICDQTLASVLTKLSGSLRVISLLGYSQLTSAGVLAALKAGGTNLTEIFVDAELLSGGDSSGGGGKAVQTALSLCPRIEVLKINGPLNDVKELSLVSPSLTRLDLSSETVKRIDLTLPKLTVLSIDTSHNLSALQFCGGCPLTSLKLWSRSFSGESFVDLLRNANVVAGIQHLNIGFIELTDLHIATVFTVKSPPLKRLQSFEMSWNGSFSDKFQWSTAAATNPTPAAAAAPPSSSSPSIITTAALTSITLIGMPITLSTLIRWLQPFAAPTSAVSLLYLRVQNCPNIRASDSAATVKTTDSKHPNPSVATTKNTAAAANPIVTALQQAYPHSLRTVRFVPARFDWKIIEWRTPPTLPPISSALASAAANLADHSAADENDDDDAAGND